MSSQIKCGPKGLTALFTSIQRRVRESFMDNRVQASNVAGIRTAREQLVQYTIRLISDSLAVGNANDVIIPNGRLCDAVLRCYVDDCDKAKNVFKALVSLGNKAEVFRDGTMLEMAEKAMEALMYIAGINYRPGNHRTTTLAHDLFAQFSDSNIH